jgi:hypothetical protein
LKETLLMTRQLIDFFWNASPDEILDPDVRIRKYGLLSNTVLLKVLPKYKKIVKKDLPKLRVRQIKAVTKEIKRI